MTKHHPDDRRKTNDLVRQLDADETWLRHTGLAAELDRRLLHGASAVELADVRASWKVHIFHLRREHGLRVEEVQPGYWRILPAPVPAYAPAAIPEGIGADDDSEEGEPGPSSGEAALPLPVQGPGRLHTTAQALAALAREDLLGSPLLKASVGMLIRQASESHHWHNCAHYRSLNAKRLIEAQRIPSAAAYQAFCRAELRHEHVVPNSVIYRMLCESPDRSVDGIEKLLAEFCIRATITRDEDRVLNADGFSAAMPQGFFQQGHALYRDPLARYRSAGLFDQLEKRGGGLWYAGE